VAVAYCGRPVGRQTRLVTPLGVAVESTSSSAMSEPVAGNSRVLGDRQSEVRCQSLQALMNHSRIDTTQVYLRALNRSQAMEAVRDLSWGPGLQPFTGKAHTGFEPVPPP
jgi:hypothetical protein